MFGYRKNQTIQFDLNGIPVTLVRKKVKNINLRVYPSRQEVRMSAPRHLRMKTIRAFAESKRAWIRKQLDRCQAPLHPDGPEYRSGEPHLFRGRRFALQVVSRTAPPGVEVNEATGRLTLFVRPGHDKAKRARVLDDWYRSYLKTEIPRLIAKWEPQMEVSVQAFGVRKMKTRWGSCNIRDRRIWLNLELAKKSPACLQYVVVHEMTHLLERLHNKRFYRLMERFLPDWEATEEELQGRVD